MQKNYKRKSYYLKSSAQTTFILRFMLISIIGGIAAVTAFNLLAAKKIDSVLYSMRLPNISGGGLLWSEMLYTNLFITFFILLVLTITARGLYVRINGPLRKMTNDITKVAAGDLSLAVSLRDKDEFKEFANELNTMVLSLNERFLAIKNASDQLIATTSLSSEEAFSEQQMGEIKKSVLELEKSLGSFKI